MSAYPKLGIVALTALLAGCSSHDPAAASHADGGIGQPVSAWVEVGVTQFQSDGETGRVAIPPQERCAAVALRATTAPGVCFQVSSVVDGKGRAW